MTTEKYQINGKIALEENLKIIVGNNDPKPPALYLK